MGYRMIIADDEEMLIRLIIKLGHFQEHGIEVVGTCRDGEEAYECILREKPDFVLTDIQMPVMDGLEMIGKCRDSCPDTLFVLLSGYRLFEYAQSAVHLNVVDYLLKPVNEEQLNTMLERLCRLTDERRQQTADRESLRSYRDREKEEKQHAFWKQIWLVDSKQPAAVRPDRLSMAADYGMDLPYDCCQVLILNCGLFFERESEAHSFYAKLCETAVRVFDGKAVLFMQSMYGLYPILLNFSADRKYDINSACAQFFAECCLLHDVFGNFRIHLAQSRIKNSIQEIPEALAEADRALWVRFAFGSDQRILAEYLDRFSPSDASSFLTADLRSRLTDAMRALDSAETEKMFAVLTAYAAAHPNLHPDAVREVYGMLREMILRQASEQGREETEARLNKALQYSRTLEELIQKIGEAASAVLTGQKALLEQKDRKPADMAREYIRRHYAEGLTLEGVAEEVGLSPAYLSRIFKEMNGCNFSDFLAGVRMEEAAKLLSGSRMPVRDIAFAVGYTDEKYFSKSFKSRFGLKPTEYRKLYG